MQKPAFFHTAALFASVLITAAQTPPIPVPAGNPASGEAFFKVAFPNVQME